MNQSQIATIKIISDYNELTNQELANLKKDEVVYDIKKEPK